MNPYPTEDQEQATLFQWAALQERRWPELRMLYAIPNGGKRIKGSHIQREQVQWIDALEKQSYRSMICKGWDEARKAIEEYLDL